CRPRFAEPGLGRDSRGFRPPLRRGLSAHGDHVRRKHDDLDVYGADVAHQRYGAARSTAGEPDVRAGARRHIAAAVRILRRGRPLVPRILHRDDRGTGMMDRFLSRDAQNFRPSAIRAFARWINDPSVISFAGGSPNPETFPAERFAEIAARVLRERRHVSLQYGPTRGLPRLCEFVAARCKVKPQEVILTTGSQQALDLVAHTLLDPGDVVAVELPTYIGGTSSFHARSARLAGVRQDEEGIVPESLAEVARATRPKFLYVIPNFQNPSG